MNATVRPEAPARGLSLPAIVQACDGRWNYGPAHLADAMASEEFGSYATADDAMRAADLAMDKVDHASERIVDELSYRLWAHNRRIDPTITAERYGRVFAVDTTGWAERFDRDLKAAP